MKKKVHLFGDLTRDSKGRILLDGRKLHEGDILFTLHCLRTEDGRNFEERLYAIIGRKSNQYELLAQEPYFSVRNVQFVRKGSRAKIWFEKLKAKLTKSYFVDPFELLELVEVA